MKGNRWLNRLSQGMMAVATTLFVLGVLTSPNVVLADPEPLAPVAVCKNCNNGGLNDCPGKAPPCLAANRLCTNQAGKVGCGSCSCEKVKNANPQKCDCFTIAL